MIRENIVFFIIISVFVGLLVFMWNSTYETHQAQMKVAINQAYQLGYIDACKDQKKGISKAKLVENDCGEKSWQFVK